MNNNKSNAKINIVVIDDHVVVREGLKGMLAGQPDFNVVGEAGNGVDGVILVKQLLPDVTLMDLRMPKGDGIQAIRQIQSEKIATHVLVLTTYDSDRDILRAIEAGATGYLLKDAPREMLFRAVRAAANGQSMLAPSVASRLMTRMRTPASDQLTAREIEVLGLVATGHSNKRVGRVLHISEATVKTHLIHIFAKLSVSDRTAAVTVALEQGVLELGGQAA